MGRILAGVIATLLLAGCSGAGIGSGGKASAAPNAPVVFWAPQAGMSFAFTWSDTRGETQYQLLEDPDSHSGYALIATLAADVTRYTVQGLPLLRRLNARYILRACNNIGCTDSAPVHIAGNLAAAVGSVSSADARRGDAFGYCLAMSDDGNTFVVGAQDADDGSGAVFVFTRSGNTWSQQASVKATNYEANDLFGASIALSGDGNTLVVGAYAEDSGATGVGGNQGDNSATNSGAAYVFTRSGNSWSPQSYLKASNAAAGDVFGLDVALSDDGNTLAVSAQQQGGSGAVYVFARGGTTWSQYSLLKASNAAAADGFGSGIALSGDGNTLAIGAVGEDSNAVGVDGNPDDNSAADSGAVYVFARGGNTFNLQSYLKASNSGAGDNFGNRVALSADGNTLAVGAWHEDSSTMGIEGAQDNNLGSDSGAAYVFTRSGNLWMQQAYLKASNAEAGDNFGHSMALSADGNTLAVGAWHEGSRAEGVNDSAQADNSFGIAGAAYVFTRSANTWNQLAYVKTPERGTTGWFSRSVALSGNGLTLAVGEVGNSGKVFLY